jgi:hydrogenase-1 operon protein HyaF
MSAGPDVPAGAGSEFEIVELPTGMAKAVLTEAIEHLRALGGGGERQIIDLKGLPMTQGDLRQLEETLGKGEVTASVDAAGPTEVFETRFPGLWWVRYQNEDRQTVAEQLVVGRVPAILETHLDDVRDSVARLEEELNDLDQKSS